MDILSSKKYQFVEEKTLQQPGIVLDSMPVKYELGKRSNHISNPSKYLIEEQNFSIQQVCQIDVTGVPKRFL